MIAELEPSTASVRSALALGADKLEESACEDARLDAELLLAHVLGWSRARLFSYPERLLSESQLQAFAQAIARRAAHEPLAYIVGHAEFYGLDLLVNASVLVPRPETELLVGLALANLRRLDGMPGCAPGARRMTVADVGTGSGAIAIALAKGCLDLEVYAVDASWAALQVAAANCRRHHIADRVKLIQGDLLSPLGGKLDGIVANLPYIGADEFAGLSPEVAQYEPRAALDGGVGGLELVSRLLATSEQHLKSPGFILLEIGAYQGEAALSLARRALPHAEVELYQDFAELDRVISIEVGGRVYGQDYA